MSLQSRRTFIWFVAIAAVVCVGYYILELINGRSQMADFRVYYDAAYAFLNGEQVYGKAFGVSSGFYKYSPFACLPFIPLSVLQYNIASVIYYVMIIAAICWMMILITRYVMKEESRMDIRTGTALFIITLFMADHIERELHLGNVNLFLLIGAYFVFIWLKRYDQLKAGIGYAVMLLFKPHFLILLPYFIWKKRWKTLGVAFISLVAGIIVPALITGYADNIRLHAEWLNAMRDHNVKLEESPNTIYGIVNHFIINHIGGAWLVVGLLAITAGMFIWLMRRNTKITGNSQVRFIEFFVLIALIPNLTHTDTEHFMWTWPLIAYSVIFILQKKFDWRNAIIMSMVVAFIPYTLNSPDIVGSKLRFLFDEGGLLGLANLIFIASAVMISVHASNNITQHAQSRMDI